MVQPHHRFSQLATAQSISTRNPAEQAAAQRRRQPAARYAQRHIAARAFCDFARFVPQQGVKDFRLGRREGLVMGAPRGFKSHKLTMRLRHRMAGQRQLHTCRRGVQGVGLCRCLATGVEQQAHAPQPRGVLQRQRLKTLRYLHFLLWLPRVTKMRSGRRHARQVRRRSAQLAVV